MIGASGGLQTSMRVGPTEGFIGGWKSGRLKVRIQAAATAPGPPGLLRHFSAKPEEGHARAVHYQISYSWADSGGACASPLQ
eukprot:9302933-Karenia_brevis.AAC.1